MLITLQSTTKALPAVSRATKLAALNAAIAHGIADADADRVTDIDEVFDELEARYEKMAEQKRA